MPFGRVAGADRALGFALNGAHCCATLAAVKNGAARPVGQPLPISTSLGDLLRGLAARYRQRTAVADEHEALSFAELDRRADAWMAALVRAGFGRGAHVGLLAGNRTDWLAVAFGVWRAGATLVPLSTFVTPRELAQTLAHADVHALVVQPVLRSHDYLDALRRVLPLPELQQVIVLDDHAPAPHQSAAAFVARAGTAPRTVPIDPESLACILYTSGTTGLPKGVMLSHRAMLATTFPTAQRSGLTDTDSLLSTLPLFWVAGLVIRALPTLAAGCTLLLVEAFSADAVVAALRRHRPTAVHLRPPQVGQVLGHRDFDHSLLANVRRGNGRVEWYHPYLDADQCRFITGYGMTEMSGYVTALHWQDAAEVRKTQLGTPLPGVELRILDAAGRVCKANQTGEVRVRGPGMFSGYYKQPPGTGLDREGFFVTGDLGRIDGNGTFHFDGRSKDLLRVKGINVSPLEVEAVLSTHPAVEAAYVIGLPPDGLEQRLVALIIARSAAAPLTDAQLRAHAAEALSHYKCPEEYVFIDRSEVPLGGTAKPLRAALAELAAHRLPPWSLR
jgi:fatty-acyl-CoA synthase